MELDKFEKFQVQYNLAFEEFKSSTLEMAREKKYFDGAESKPTFDEDELVTIKNKIEIMRSTLNPISENKKARDIIAKNLQDLFDELIVLYPRRLKIEGLEKIMLPITLLPSLTSFGNEVMYRTFGFMEVWETLYKQTKKIDISKPLNKLLDIFMEYLKKTNKPKND